MKVEIIKMEGLVSGSKQPDMIAAGLKIGDKIEVKPFVNNAVYYKNSNDDVVFIYTWNIKEINT